MKRAVTVYVDQNREQLLYFGNLYTSYKYIKTPDTDLIVFAPKQIHSLLPSDIIKISFSGTYPDYPYLHSIEYLLDEKASVLDKYDFILRTETDTFLTPAWNRFAPTLFSTGRGRYVNSSKVEDHLKRITSEMGLDHRGIHNIGASHYGAPAIIRDVCRLSIQIANYLLDYEFRENEGIWPGWYRGVISMYSNEIAINHLVDQFEINSGQLDFDSTSTDSIFQHSHLHCWHTTELFSKFMYTANQYHPSLLTSLNNKTVRNYCLYIALKSTDEVPIQKSLLSLSD